jgi:hypothetical protein
MPESGLEAVAALPLRRLAWCPQRLEPLFLNMAELPHS